MSIIYVAIVLAYFGTTQGVPADLIKGSDVLDLTPLIDGQNQFIQYLYLEKRNISRNFDFKKNLIGDPILGTTSTDLPRLKIGKVGGQMWSITASCQSQYKDAVQSTLSQIDLIKRLVEKNSDAMELVTSSDDITTVWMKGKIGSMIALEGGHSLDSNLAILRMYYELGVRSIALISFCNTPWISNSNNKLTDFGKKIVWEMNRLGMLIDLTHSSQDIMNIILAITRSPIIISHSSATTICNANKSVSDAILQQVKFNNGIIMVNIDTNCDTTQNGTLDDVVAHINYIKTRIGVDYVGIGLGYHGIPKPVVGLEDVSKYPALFDRLYNNQENEEKWTREDLEKLAGKNFIRVFKTVENIRDCMKWQVPDEDVINDVEVQNAQTESGHTLASCHTE